MKICVVVASVGLVVQLYGLLSFNDLRAGHGSFKDYWLTLANMMVTGTGVVYFGRPLWPFFVQFFGLVFLVVLLALTGWGRIYVGLLGWWNETILYLMMLAMGYEYYRNIRKHRAD